MMTLASVVLGGTIAATPGYLGYALYHTARPDLVAVLTVLFAAQATAATAGGVIMARLVVRRHPDAQAIETLRREAFLDPLTGLHNRRYLDERLQSTLRDRCPENPLTVMLIDIDDFKAINDQIGHQAGDRVLQSVSMAIASTLRSTDTVGRYGGDEFVSVLPDSDLPQAYDLAERVRTRVSEIGGGSTLAHPSVSVGLAEFPVDGIDAAALLRAADAAMYRAKREGRNRVVGSARPIDDERAVLLGGFGGSPDLDHPLDAPACPLRNH